MTDNFFKKLRDSFEVTWKPSLNLFSGLLIDELKSLAGYIPKAGKLTLEQRNEIAAENLKFDRDDSHIEEDEANLIYPRQFSWMDADGRNFITPVKNQGFCKSCAAFGSIAAVETMARIQKDFSMDGKNSNKLQPLSEGQLFFTSPGFSINDNSSKTHNCRSGWEIDDALDFLNSHGVISENLYPYNLKDRVEKLSAGWENKITKISGYKILKTHKQMKHWLSKKGPLITVMQMKADFLFYGSGIYNHKVGLSLGGHCVCVIGYNEEYQAWLCKNSWSEHWGEDGFFWIEYGECGIDSEMWAIEAVSQIYENS